LRCDYLQVACTGDEEPLVDGGVDRGSGLGCGSGEGLDDVVLSSDLVRAALDRDVADLDIIGLSLGGDVTLDQTLPSLMGLLDDVGGVLLVLGLTREGKLVLGLSIGDLVNAEPLVGGTDESGQVTLDILDIVELAGKRIVNVDHNDLPVGLA